MLRATLVRTPQDAMLELRGKLFPEDNEGADPYPDDGDRMIKVDSKHIPLVPAARGGQT